MQHDAVLAGIRDIQDEMIELRHRIHAHPELSFEEFVTSDLNADCLQRWGYAVHRGLGGTGVVGNLHNGEGRALIWTRCPFKRPPAWPMRASSKAKCMLARDANSATFLTFQSFGIAAVIYLAVTFVGAD
ncbi:Hippurate hydrolase [compost metagenome]